MWQLPARKLRFVDFDQRFGARLDWSDLLVHLNGDAFQRLIFFIAQVCLSLEVSAELGGVFSFVLGSLSFLF